MSLTTAMPADAGDGLSTARLVLRRYTQADLPSLIAMNADPAVMRYLGGVLTAEQSQAMYEQRITAYYGQHPGFGIWVTSLRVSSEIIGMHCLNHIHGEPLIQVGYRIAQVHWGQGYATEMALALMLYGYTRKNLEVISAITDLDHGVSQRVLGNIGLTRLADRQFPHPNLVSSGPLAYFESRRADWLAAFAPQGMPA
ncbi:MAG: GNAT family N-acetyltransferase [Nevskia sp.]|nr:GNAT family N-acetyltransferase [Nevskia sp.]